MIKSSNPRAPMTISHMVARKVSFGEKPDSCDASRRIPAENPTSKQHIQPTDIPMNNLNNVDIGALAKPRARNAARMAEISGPHFNATYEKGLMGVSCRVGDYRRIEIATTGQQVVDYTRCGYLNLDSHPRVLAAARAATDEIKSVHFSVARTRTSSLTTRLQVRSRRLPRSGVGPDSVPGRRQW
jgi:hypothetical protein